LLNLKTSLSHLKRYQYLAQLTTQKSTLTADFFELGKQE